MVRLGVGLQIAAVVELDDLPTVLAARQVDEEQLVEAALA
jgi:hypothetical protein